MGANCEFEMLKVGHQSALEEEERKNGNSKMRKKRDIIDLSKNMASWGTASLTE